MWFWSSFYCSDGPKAHFRTIWKWTKIAFWHVIIIFEDKTKWTKNAISRQLLHVIWTPLKHFSGSKIKLYAVGLMILYSSTGRFTKLGMSLTDNEPSQALFMPLLTCAAHTITHGNHQQKCPEMKKKIFCIVPNSKGLPIMF